MWFTHTVTHTNTRDNHSDNLLTEAGLGYHGVFEHNPITTKTQNTAIIKAQKHETQKAK